MKTPQSTRRQFLKETTAAALTGASAWSGLGPLKAQERVPPGHLSLQDYGRFTDRARDVVRLALEAAHRCTGYLATEHILLGLLMEGQGVGVHVLMNLGVDIHGVQLEVEEIIGAGPAIVMRGDLPKTPRARNVIEFSRLEARDLKHNYVGTEHILLALLREQEGVAAQILMNLGLTRVDVREEALNLLGHGLTCPRRAPPN